MYREICDTIAHAANATKRSIFSLFHVGAITAVCMFVDLTVRKAVILAVGYLYCGQCSDHQALMPLGEAASGYELKIICAYCVVFLSGTC